jgi:dTDP-4-dehydrorhamnose 3,5-epimerase
MKYQELDIKGAWLIQHGVFGDSRGQLERILDRSGSEKHGIDTRVEHSLISSNPDLGTLRGFHFQNTPFVEAKTITCLSGSIYDVVVDLRMDSPTYCSWVAVELHAGDHRSLHVPSGCANGWLTLSANTSLHYYMAEKFSPDHGRGFRFDDPAFEVQWPASPVVIAERDLNWLAFDRTSDGIQL